VCAAAPLVQLRGLSGSATAPAQSPALWIWIVLAATSVEPRRIPVTSTAWLDSSQVSPALMVLSTVLPGSFVQIDAGFVLNRARVSSSQDLGAISTQMVPR
jgi:hypothetical protein